MNNHWCAVCGHANRPGAEVCEVCDARLGDGSSAKTSVGASAGESGHANESGFGQGPSHAYDEAPRSTYDEAPRTSAPAVSQRRFGGVGDVFGPTLEVYRKNFLLIITLVVATTVPALLLQLALFRAMDFTSAESISFAIKVNYVVWLVAFAGTSLLSGALVYAIMDLQTLGASSAKSSLLRGLKTLPKVFLVQIIYWIIVGVGFLLFVFPGIILSILFALTVPVAVLERRGPFESFGRSVELTSGYRWRLLLTYFLWLVAVMIINWVIVGSFSYRAGINTFVHMLLSSLVGGVLNSSTAVLTVFIYLGILNEKGNGLGASDFSRARASAGF